MSDPSNPCVILELNGLAAVDLICKQPTIVSHQNQTTCIVVHGTLFRAIMRYSNPQHACWLRSACFLITNNTTLHNETCDQQCYLFTNKQGTKCSKLETVSLHHTKDQIMETFWGVRGAGMYTELRHVDDVTCGIDIELDVLHLLSLISPHIESAIGTITIENMETSDKAHSHVQLLNLWFCVDVHSEPLFLSTIEASKYQSHRCRASGQPAQLPTNTRVHVTCPLLFWKELHRLSSMSTDTDFATTNIQRKDLIRISANSVVWVVSDKSCKHRIEAVSVAQMNIHNEKHNG